MSPMWRRGAVDLAAAVRNKEVSACEVTTIVLDRIDEANPGVNALVEVLHDEAMAAAEAADQALAEGRVLGPLHGVPVTIKVNVDVAGHATTDGVVALADQVAETDSPLVENLRRAGAVIVGRSNTPAFSLRWFTDNELHGRTLNPFDASVTPGGSSGGAAAAAALGMGAIAHGNDYGGSIRYPAWACGVVGLRPTIGRVPSHKSSSAAERGISNQLMAVQGPLARSVDDVRLALEVLAAGSHLDPTWVPAPLEHDDLDQRRVVAVFTRHPAFDADPTVVAAIEQAAQWLSASGYEVEEVEPPHFEEGAVLWRRLVYDDLRRGGLPAIEQFGDEAVRTNIRFTMHGQPELDRDGYLDGLARRLTLLRAWGEFFERHHVLLMPNSWQRQFPVDADTVSVERMNDIIAAQSPLLGTAMMGLPGLSVPTGIVDGLPVGVQLVSGRFREDVCLRAGAAVERSARFSSLDHLAP